MNVEEAVDPDVLTATVYVPSAVSTGSLRVRFQYEMFLDV